MTRSRIRKIARVRSTPHTRLMATAVPLASAISAILGSASPVFAQESAELGEIIVTAQKREENLQNVPLSIQAIGSEKIEELHLTDFADYAAFLPSLSYQSGGQSGGSGFARPYMRGVASGGDGNHSASPPSVGMYLDEQPITTISGALDIHMYDIARVEALAGPQGTLYGASSEAGTVRIITNKPDPSGFQAGYDLEGNSVDHGGTGYTFEGFANIPISDSAAVRLVGWYEDNPGFIDNVHGTLTYPTSGVTIDNANLVKKDYNDGENYGARAALKLDLGENWTVTPSVMGQWSKSNGSYGYRVGEPFEITRFNPESAKDEWWQAALTVEGRIGNFDLVYAGSYLNRDDWTKSDYVDYSFFYDNAYGSGYLRKERCRQLHRSDAVHLGQGQVQDAKPRAAHLLAARPALPFRGGAVLRAQPARHRAALPDQQSRRADSDSAEVIAGGNGLARYLVADRAGARR